MAPYINLPNVNAGSPYMTGAAGSMGGGSMGGGMGGLLGGLGGLAGLAGGPWGVGASALASILGGLFNRQRDPMADYRRTAGLTYGAETPTGFAQGAFNDWMGSPAYQGIQRNLFGQSQGFSNQLQGSLANRGLLNSGLGNIVGSLGQSLYGGNIANAQGQAYQGFLGIAPEFFRLRQSLAGQAPQPPSFGQAFGQGLQGLGNFGLMSQMMRSIPGQRA